MRGPAWHSHSEHGTEEASNDQAPETGHARPGRRRNRGPSGAWDPSDGRHDQCLGTHMSVSVETLAILSREVRAGSGQAVIGSAR